MNKTAKILLGVGLPLAVLGVYWFGIRNRKPFFMLSKYDFVNNKTNVDFGYNQKIVALGDSGEMTAGKTYNPNKYKLVFTSKNKKVISKNYTNNIMYLDISIKNRGKLKSHFITCYLLSPFLLFVV